MLYIHVARKNTRRDLYMTSWHRDWRKKIQPKGRVESKPGTGRLLMQDGFCRSDQYLIGGIGSARMVDRSTALSIASSISPMSEIMSPLTR